MTREQLGLPARGHVLLMPSPPGRAGGQYYGVWAMAMVHQIWPDARMIVPGVSREANRLDRLVRNLYCPEVYRLTGDRYSPAELLGVADLFVAPALGDVPTGWIAWAMAAGVPIVASAVPANTELLADRHNALLCRAGRPHTLAIRIRTALESPELLRSCAEVARGQAYDVFRSRQCAEEYARAIRAAASGEPGTQATRDAAVHA